MTEPCCGNCQHWVYIHEYEIYWCTAKNFRIEMTDEPCRLYERDELADY